ncbi:C45 family autoproteolytic acyltransferase/hydolase [Niallia sp. Krafla_26]|uniref:C45 family autoproteolytic acyltransferase/hydolase n=1 Tax=Niallia sp. Krafla_26 TaxID=3064703 RepID=UPI003D17B2C0
MINVYSDVIQFRGNHYDFGYKQGELLKDSLILANREKQWSKPSIKYNYSIDEKEVKKMILSFSPGIWDELIGLSDSLKMRMNDTILQFGGYYHEYGKSGCSIFTGTNFLMRNYDNDPLSYEGRYVLYQPVDQGYATIGPSMQITGRTDGINEKGLAMGYNLINRVRSDTGFICNMIGRIVLETCANVEEAISLLKKIPHRRSFSYVLLDQTGKSIVVEASPREVIIHQSNICTNHFEILTHENRYRIEDSLQRYQAIQRQENHVLNANTAFQLMNGTGKGVFSKKYGAWSGTLHTAGYFPNSRSAWFALGGDKRPVIFDFDKWLNGEKIHVKRIRGELDTTIPFVNM